MLTFKNLWALFAGLLGYFILVSLVNQLGVIDTETFYGLAHTNWPLVVSLSFIFAVLAGLGTSYFAGSWKFVVGSLPGFFIGVIPGLGVMLTIHDQTPLAANAPISSWVFPANPSINIMVAGVVLNTVGPMIGAFLYSKILNGANVVRRTSG